VENHYVYGAWPVRRQTYCYLPSRKASPPIGRYQIILLGDRGTCVLTTCPGLYSRAGRPGFELATCLMQVQHPNHSTEANNISVGLTGRDDLSKSVRMNSVWGPNMLTGRIGPLCMRILPSQITNSSQSAGQA